MNPPSPNAQPIITLASEFDRMRASRDYADQWRTVLLARLEQLASHCAALNEQLSELEREALAIADALR